MKKKKAEQIVPEKVAIEAPENTGSISLEEFLTKIPLERSRIYLALNPEEKDKIFKALSPEEMSEMIIAHLQSPEGKAEYEESKKKSDELGRAFRNSMIVSDELLKSRVTI
jgi:hypothetical protein